MTTISVDTSKAIKKMKPMHGGGQPPVLANAKDTYFHYLTEAGIPYSRLHDVGGSFGDGKYVDIPNIFPNFDADENDPASYDFTFTDWLLNQLVEAGVEPYYRLGTTIENASVRVKPLKTFPPKDYGKWARICEHIIAHYIDGWADGFHHRITYWEIWNEPDNKQMWVGTAEDYYRLYDVASKHLKSVFGDRIKVGGFASCGFYAVNTVNGNPFANSKETELRLVEYFRNFMEYVKAHGSPLDFFSWHSYAPTMQTAEQDKWVKEQMIAYGYPDTELHLNEWCPYQELGGTGKQSAEIAGIMVAMQNGNEDVLCIYDMRIGEPWYAPFFDCKTCKPHHGYYSAVAFNALYQLGTQVKCECDTDGIYTAAASNGKKHAMMIVNLTGRPQELTIDGVELADARFYAIDDQRLLSWTANAREIGTDTVLLIEW